MEALVISLGISEDRWKRTERECSRIGLKAKRLIAFDATEGATWFPNSKVKGGALGLIASVDHALSQVTNESDDWILLLEDDARFTFRTRSIESLAHLTLAVPATVGAIHLGYMTGNELLSDQYPVRKRLRIFLRPRSRFREARKWIYRRNSYEWNFPPKPPIHWGSQGLLVRTSLASEVRSALLTYDVPQDNKINQCLHSHPELFVRTRKPFITQRVTRSVRIGIDNQSN